MDLRTTVADAWRATPRPTCDRERARRTRGRRVARSVVLGHVLGGAALATVVLGGVGPFPSPLTASSAAVGAHAAAATGHAGAASGEGPARWEPCRSVAVYVDGDGAPTGWDAVVEDAVEHVAHVSGLRVRFAGVVDAASVRAPEAGQPAVALLTWADAEDEPALRHETALTTHVAHGPAGGPRHVALAWSVVRTGTVTPVDFALDELFAAERVPPAGDDAC